jgi:hypothetical protein
LNWAGVSFVAPFRPPAPPLSLQNFANHIYVWAARSRTAGTNGDHKRFTNQRDRNGFGIMELLDMELARARQRLIRAERSLERANEMLDDDCGVGINIALCSRIRAAQQRVIEARSRLTKIDPTSAEGVRTG